MHLKFANCVRYARTGIRRDTLRRREFKSYSEFGAGDRRAAPRRCALKILRRPNCSKNIFLPTTRPADVVLIVTVIYKMFNEILVILLSLNQPSFVLRRRARVGKIIQNWNRDFNNFKFIATRNFLQDRRCECRHVYEGVARVSASTPRSPSNIFFPPPPTKASVARARIESTLLLSKKIAELPSPTNKQPLDPNSLFLSFLFTLSF